MEEQELLALLRSRDPQGMDALQRIYGPLMRYIVTPILQDPREREECLSDISMAVWEKIERFDPSRGSWTAWLTAVTRNAALNRARSSRADSPIPEALPDPAPGPEAALLLRERMAQLRNALNRLSQEDRALFYRKYYYLQSTAQIAREMGLTLRGVEGRLYRIKKRLKGQLGGDFYD